MEMVLSFTLLFPKKNYSIVFQRSLDSFVRQDTLLGARAKNPRRIHSNPIDQNTCMCPVQKKNMHVNTMAITYTVSDPDLLRTHASLDMPSLRPKAGMWGSSESPQIQG